MKKLFNMSLVLSSFFPMQLVAQNQTVALTTVDGTQVQVSRQEVLRGLKADGEKNSVTYEKFQFIGQNAVIDFPSVIYDGNKIPMALEKYADEVGACRLFGFEVAVTSSGDASYVVPRCGDNDKGNHAVITAAAGLVKIGGCTDGYALKRIICKNK